jgi:hypothetical protein
MRHEINDRDSDDSKGKIADQIKIEILDICPTGRIELTGDPQIQKRSKERNQVLHIIFSTAMT